MDRNEAIKNLNTLSPRERQVLEMICSGLMEKEIAQKLKIKLPTVKSDFGKICVKFGIDQLSQGERRKIIYQIYCPLVESSELIIEPLPHEKNEPIPPEKAESILPEESEPEPPEEDEPVPLAIMNMVDEDEPGKTPPPPEKVIYIPEPKKPDTGGQRSGPPVARIIVGVFAVVCLIIVIVLLRGRSIPGETPTQVPPQNLAATQAIMPENTATPIPTSAQLLPTDTPAAQENTAVPTNPPAPTTAPLPTAVVPSIPLPFSDDFSNGANPAWNVLSGSWLTADGRYTISNADDKWGFSVLDDPSWTNYRVKVNVKLESSDEGEIAIIVRYGGSKFLAFHVDNIFSKGGWAFYDGNSFTNISGYGSIRTSHQFDLEVDAIGNEFIARINGMETQRISLSGYDKGGVALGISCFSPACSSFGNFQVSAAP